MFKNLDKYAKNVNLMEDEFDAYIKEQTRYLMSIYKNKKFISNRDLKKSYMILYKFQDSRLKNRVQEFTNKKEIIDNIEEIVRLRKQNISHAKIAQVMPISKATIQKYLKLLKVDK